MPQVVDQNKLYASEVLSILVQDSEANQLRVGQGEGMDRLSSRQRVVSNAERVGRSEWGGASSEKRVARREARGARSE